MFDQSVHRLRGEIANGAVDVDVAGLLDERDQSGEDGFVLGIDAALGGEGLDGAGEASDDERGRGGFAEEGLAVER